MQAKKTVRRFEDLYVWQLAIELVKRVYILTDSGPLRRDFGLRDQMRRSSVSIPTNIAEGFERFSRKEYLFFLNVAKGSAGELRILCRVALDVSYINEPTHMEIGELVTKLSASLQRQMKSLRSVS